MRILVIRAGQLGDTVCASSIIEPLRHHFGNDVVIDWVTKAGIGRVFAQDQRVHRIFELRNRRLPLPFNMRKLKIVLLSWCHPYDYAVNLELGHIFNDIMHLVRARNKIGMPYRYFAEPAETHAVENLKLIYHSFLNVDDLDKAIPSLQGTPTQDVKERFNLPHNYYILVPANSHRHKKGRPNYRVWPEVHWRKLIQRMSEKGLQGVIIGGKSDEPLLKKLWPLPPHIISLVGKTSFPELIGLIDGAQGMISTDTGPSHIAAAVNTPVFALIGPTNFKRTGPYQTKSNQVTVISANLPCSPCYHTARHLNCTDNKCMSEILPEQILQAIG